MQNAQVLDEPMMSLLKVVLGKTFSSKTGRREMMFNFQKLCSQLQTLKLKPGRLFLKRVAAKVVILKYAQHLKMLKLLATFFISIRVLSKRHRGQLFNLEHIFSCYQRFEL
jgi:hypothetical protein